MSFQCVALAFALVAVANPALSQSSNPLATATEYEIANFVGTTGGPGSADGIGLRARFYAPSGMWSDETNLYVADGANHAIRKIVLATGTVTTLAGRPGPPGYVDGSATDARFNFLEGLWGDGSFLYVADVGNRNIRKIDLATGAVTTLAGGAGVQGLTDGVGTAARFLAPGPIWGDGNDLYVGDISNAARVIRRINIASGQVTTIANLTTIPNGSTFLGIWGDGTNLWIADAAVNAIRKLVLSTGQITVFAGTLAVGSADGSATTASFFGPSGIWGDGTNLFVADSSNGTIRIVSMETGDTTTIAGFAEELGADDGIGPLARFDFPFFLWGSGSNLYVADYGNSNIRRVITTTTSVTTVAGAAGGEGTVDGRGGEARLSGPVMISGDGTNLYIADAGSTNIRVANLSTGDVSTIAGTPGTDDDLDGIGTAAHFRAPFGITNDDTNVYVTDATADTIRKIAISTGQVTTLAGNANVASGYAEGIGSAARFYLPLGIWGNGMYLWVADRNNYIIRRIVIATGQVATFAGVAGAQQINDGLGQAARFVFPQALWGDGTNLYLADGHAIRRISIATAQVTTIAGNLTTPGASDGIGSAASFNFPLGLWGDGSNLYVADSGSATIRKIDLSTNRVTTIIGTPLTPGTENGRGGAGRLSYPAGLWGDGTYLYVADNGGHNIRRIAAWDSSALSFTIANRGAVSSTTAGAGEGINVGYGRIQPDSNSTTPAGLAIFGFTQNNILVSEAAVPAAPLVQSARTYAEIGAGVNTGIAIANPNPQAVTIEFYFTTAAGSNINPGSTTIPANGQIAAFLDQRPFSFPSAFQGAFTITASLPVSVIALRGFTNERSEFLITTLPVTPINAQIAAPLVLPDFVSGGGWKTQMILVNPTDEPLTGTIEVLTTAGVPSAPSNFSVAPRSSFKTQSAGTGDVVASGWVRVTPTNGSRTPAGFGVFSFRNAGVTVTEAGVPALPTASAFRLYAEASGNAGEAGSIQTGFAIANPTSSAVTVNFELTGLDGSPTGLSGSITVPPNGQDARFLNQVQGLSNIPLPFQGLLRISGAGISVLGLRGRYNPRGDFLITTTSPIAESSPTTNSEFVFPHLADGGGYTTQLILFSGSAGQTSSGTVHFFDQSGQPLPVR